MKVIALLFDEDQDSPIKEGTRLIEVQAAIPGVSPAVYKEVCSYSSIKMVEFDGFVGTMSTYRNWEPEFTKQEWGIRSRIVTDKYKESSRHIGFTANESTFKASFLDRNLTIDLLQLLEDHANLDK